MSHFPDDVTGGSFPNERLRTRVMVLQIVENSCFKVSYRGEGASADPLLCHQAKKALDLIKPRGRSGRKVQLKAQVLFQPGFHLGVIVGHVVVNDQMQIQALRCLSINDAQEAQKLLVTVALEHCPMTAPVATLSAAKRVVVPWRL